MMMMQMLKASNKEIGKQEQEWNVDGKDSFSSEFNSTYNNSNNNIKISDSKQGLQQIILLMQTVALEQH
jgi:uncharacterized protein YukE